MKHFRWILHGLIVLGVLLIQTVLAYSWPFDKKGKGEKANSAGEERDLVPSQESAGNPAAGTETGPELENEAAETAQAAARNAQSQTLQARQIQNLSKFTAVPSEGRVGENAVPAALKDLQKAENVIPSSTAPQGNPGAVPDIPSLNLPSSGQYETPAGLVKKPAAASGNSIPSMQLPQSALTPDPEIYKIQNQIKEIIALNESLKSRYKEQATQIQKIGDQARIHQRILDDLNQNSSAGTGTEAGVRDEKVRLIQQETDQNRNFINNLQRGEKPGDSKASASSAGVR